MEASSAELLGLRLNGIKRIVDVGTGTLDLTTALDLPTDATYERRDAAELEVGSLGAGDLLLGLVGPDLVRDGRPEFVLSALQGLAPGARFLLLLGGPATDLPQGALVAGLSSAHCQIEEMVPLVDDHVVGAARGAQVRPVPGAGSSRDGRAAEDAFVTALRVSNRTLIESFVDASVAPTVAEALPPDPALRRDVQRLRQRLRESEERLEAVETSTSYRIGRVLVRAIRSPRRVTRIAKDLVPIWRSRTTAQRPPRKQAEDSPVDSVSAWYEAIRYAPERLLLAYSAGPAGARSRLVIAGVLRDELAGSLETEAIVHRMGPNDARLVLERADPDLVLVETGAFGAGLPWAFAGSPGAVDRDRTLLDILDSSRALGRPSVLWLTGATPEPVGLHDLARRFDLVVRGLPGNGDSWAPGVPLALFNPIDLDPTRSGPPLMIGRWNAHAPSATRALMEEFLGAAAAEGLEIRVDARALGGRESFPESLRPSLRGTVDPLAGGALYRSRSVVLADPSGDELGTLRALEALACGARLVTLENPVLMQAGGDAVTSIEDDQEAGPAIRAALAAGARQAPEVRAGMRAIFAEHAVPVALAALVERLGLKIDPLRQRGVAAIPWPADGRDWGSIVDEILIQSHRPREIVVERGFEPGPAEHALDALRSAGVAVRFVDQTDSWARLAALAGAATTPWVAVWGSEHGRGRDYLLDLMVAAESSRADVIGSAVDGAWRYVDDLSVAGSVVRRELLAGGPPGEFDELSGSPSFRPWARRGVKLFGIPTTGAGGV